MTDLRHKTCFIKLTKVKIITSIFSKHNALKLKINCKNEARKTTSTWRLNNMLLNNNWLNEEIKEEIKRNIVKMRKTIWHIKILVTFLRDSYPKLEKNSHNSKSKQSILKVGQGLEQTFLEREYTDGQLRNKLINCVWFLLVNYMKSLAKDMIRLETW